jgi:hypothetical protein
LTPELRNKLLTSSGPQIPEIESLVFLAWTTICGLMRVWWAYWRLKFLIADLPPSHLINQSKLDWSMKDTNKPDLLHQNTQIDISWFDVSRQNWPSFYR